MQGRVFWGCIDTGSHFVVKYTKSPFWGREQAFSGLMHKILNLHVVENTAPITTKFCAVTKTIKCSFQVIQTHTQQIQYGRQQPFWKKIEISPYLSNGTTFATVTYTGTLKSKPLLAIKIPDFKNPRWRTADSLKNRLVLTTVLPIRTKSGARTYHYTSSSPFKPHVQVKFQWCFGARFTKNLRKILSLA